MKESVQKGKGLRTPPTRKHFLFGYGSLIDRVSRMSTNPHALAAYPAIVEGVARGWWVHGTPVNCTTCFLSAIAEAGARCNGVLYPVTDVELEQTDRREAMYDRIEIDPRQITFLDGRKALPAETTVWFYALPKDPFYANQHPNADFPITQSYVDICLNGCLEMEALYPLAEDKNFARMFIQETCNWSPYWVNDRLQPRRPNAHLPRSMQIDTLLREELPDVFPHVKFESAQWD